MTVQELIEKLQQYEGHGEIKFHNLTPSRRVTCPECNESFTTNSDSVDCDISKIRARSDRFGIIIELR